jgi:hypothetical protein
MSSMVQDEMSVVCIQYIVLYSVFNIVYSLLIKHVLNINLRLQPVTPLVQEPAKSV